MISDLFQIFRARNNPPIAVKLAANMAQGQLFDRITAPLVIIHLLLWSVVVICTAIALGLTYLAVRFHWSAMFPFAIVAALGGVALYVSFGLKRGLNKVRSLAAFVSDKGVDHVMGKMGQDPAVTLTPAPTDDSVP